MFRVFDMFRVFAKMMENQMEQIKIEAGVREGFMASTVESPKRRGLF